MNKWASHCIPQKAPAALCVFRDTELYSLIDQFGLASFTVNHTLCLLVLVDLVVSIQSSNRADRAFAGTFRVQCSSSFVLLNLMEPAFTPETLQMSW